MVYITWNLVSEAEFDTKNMAKLFKENAAANKVKFLKLSLQNTYGQLMASWSIPNLLA